VVDALLLTIESKIAPPQQSGVLIERPQKSLDGARSAPLTDRVSGVRGFED
jgi:hypothetical protein